MVERFLAWIWPRTPTPEVKEAQHGVWSVSAALTMQFAEHLSEQKL